MPTAFALRVASGVALVALAATGGACGGGASTPGSIADGAGSDGASSEDDGAADATLDATVDVAADAIPDATLDTTNVTPDASHEAGRDAAADAGEDSGLDAARDAGLDSGGQGEAGITCLGQVANNFPDSAPLTLGVDAAVVGAPLVVTADGGPLTFAGITSDDLAIYSLGDGVVRAAPLDGGPVQVAVPASDAGALVGTAVGGPWVIAWDSSGSSRVWRSGTAPFAGPVVPAGQSGAIDAVSADGSRAAVRTLGSCAPDQAIDQATRTTTVLAPPSDGGCGSIGGFSGATAVGGDSTPAIAGYKGASWTEKTYCAGCTLAAVSPTVPGFLQLTPCAGCLSTLAFRSLTAAAPVGIDNYALVAWFTPDGTAFYYLRNPHEPDPTREELWSGLTSAPQFVKELVSCNLGNLLGGSPDGKFLAVTSTWVSSTGNGDLWLTSTTTPGAHLVGYQSMLLAFTDDSAQILFSSSDVPGTWAEPVSGGTPALLGVGATWGCGAFPTSGSKVLITNDLTLYEWDTASANPPVLLGNLPDYPWKGSVSASKQFLVFTNVQTSAIYSVAVP